MRYWCLANRLVLLFRLAVLFLFLHGAQADLPVHCLHGHVVGRWTIHVGEWVVNKDGKEVKDAYCGYEVPDRTSHANRPYQRPPLRADSPFRELPSSEGGGTGWTFEIEFGGSDASFPSLTPSTPVKVLPGFTLVTPDSATRSDEESLVYADLDTVWTVIYDESFHFEITGKPTEGGSGEARKATFAAFFKYEDGPAELTWGGNLGGQAQRPSEVQMQSDLSHEGRSFCWASMVGHAEIEATAESEGKKFCWWGERTDVGSSSASVVHNSVTLHDWDKWVGRENQVFADAIRFWYDQWKSRSTEQGGSPVTSFLQVGTGGRGEGRTALLEETRKRERRWQKKRTSMRRRLGSDGLERIMGIERIHTEGERDREVQRQSPSMALLQLADMRLGERAQLNEEASYTEKQTRLQAEMRLRDLHASETIPEAELPEFAEFLLKLSRREDKGHISGTMPVTWWPLLQTTNGVTLYVPLEVGHGVFGSGGVQKTGGSGEKLDSFMVFSRGSQRAKLSTHMLPNLGIHPDATRRLMQILKSAREGAEEPWANDASLPGFSWTSKTDLVPVLRERMKASGLFSDSEVESRLSLIDDELGLLPTTLDQGNCGSCYSVASTGMYSQRLFVEMLTNPEFSEEDISLIVSKRRRLSVHQGANCNVLNQGCDGGYPFLLNRALRDRGIMLQDCENKIRDDVGETVDADPAREQALCAALGGQVDENFHSELKGNILESRKALDREQRDGEGVCRYKAWVTTWSYLGGAYGWCDERLLKHALYFDGPVLVSLEPGPKFGKNTNNVLYGTGPSESEATVQKGGGTDFYEYQKVDHSLLLVGWGTEPNGDKYWLTQNSWGPRWGFRVGEGDNSGGFRKIQRGVNLFSIESIRLGAKLFVKKISAQTAKPTLSLSDAGFFQQQQGQPVPSPSSESRDEREGEGEDTDSLSDSAEATSG